MIKSVRSVYLRYPILVDSSFNYAKLVYEYSGIWVADIYFNGARILQHHETIEEDEYN